MEREVLVNRSVLTTYSNGDQRITGIFKQRLTNLTTGTFIDLTSPGPVLLDYHADGSLTETDWGPQFERPPGQLLITTGVVVWEFDSDGNFVSYTQLSGSTQTSASSSASRPARVAACCFARKAAPPQRSRRE